MRETCARVLAAALMTGAIATVVAMSALSGATGEAGRPFAAPPSSLKRYVPVVRQAIQPRPGSVRLTAASISARPRPVVVTRRPVVARHWSPRQLAAAKPKTKAKPAQAPPAPAPTPTPAAEPAPPTAEAAQLVEAPQPAASADGPGQQQGTSDDAHGEHGRGHAYGHDKHDD
jgi:hypothetical protein